MRRRHIGIVFQFFNLLEGMSVLENVTLPAVIAGAPRKRAETRARDLLDLLGLADKAKDAPGVLSGGQRQRLAIARALANEPTLLLADEPTGALDSEGGHEVLELFRRLHAGGQTILMVTHDDEVAAAGDRIVRMRDGRIVTEAREPRPSPPGRRRPEPALPRDRAWPRSGSAFAARSRARWRPASPSRCWRAPRAGSPSRRSPAHGAPTPRSPDCSGDRAADVLVNPDLGTDSGLPRPRVALLPRVEQVGRFDGLLVVLVAAPTSPRLHALRRSSLDGRRRHTRSHGGRSWTGACRSRAGRTR